jgi:hypothetical protein
MPSLDLPSAKDILAKEDLESLKLVASVRSEIDTGRERWKQRVADVSDKAKLDEYRRRADEIRKSAKAGGGPAGNVAEAAQLRKRDGGLDQVKGARQDLAKDIDTPAPNQRNQAAPQGREAAQGQVRLTTMGWPI